MVNDRNVTDNADAADKFYSQIRISGINNLHHVRNGAYTTTISTLRQIRGIGYHFTEVRISCKKKWHNSMVRNKNCDGYYKTYKDKIYIYTVESL